MAAKNTTDPLVEGFKELKLAGMAATVTTRLTQAAGGELGYRELVQALIDDQREHRDATAIARRQRAAQFEDPGMLEDFDYGFSPERRKVAGLIRDLTQIEGWQPTGRSIILHGPTGTGKSRVAQGLGQIAIRRGMDVRFAPTSTLLEQLAPGPRQGHGRVGPKDGHPGQARGPGLGRLRRPLLRLRRDPRPVRTDHPTAWQIHDRHLRLQPQGVVPAI